MSKRQRGVKEADPTLNSLASAIDSADPTYFCRVVQAQVRRDARRVRRWRTYLSAQPDAGGSKLMEAPRGSRSMFESGSIMKQ